jgi:hypothetical protein
MFLLVPRHGFDFQPAVRGRGTRCATRAVKGLDPDAPGRDELPAPFWLGVVTGRRPRRVIKSGASAIPSASILRFCGRATQPRQQSLWAASEAGSAPKILLQSDSRYTFSCGRPALRWIPRRTRPRRSAAIARSKTQVSIKTPVSVTPWSSIRPENRKSLMAPIFWCATGSSSSGRTH